MPLITNKKTSIIAASALYALLSGFPVLADDIEIFLGENQINTPNPNVLFIIDTSGSMDNVDGRANGNMRIEEVQDAFDMVMDNYFGSGINVGLMAFDANNTGCVIEEEEGMGGGNTRTCTTGPGADTAADDNDPISGGYVVKAMQELTSSNYGDFKTKAGDLTPNYSTPLSETLYEAAMYYRGGAVKFGGNAAPVSADGTTTVWDRTSTVGGLGATYITPITDKCQSNNIILLTDGQPNSDMEANDLINSLTGTTCTGNGGCLDELAIYLHNNDNNLDQTNFPGNQTINTYAIGFDIGDLSDYVANLTALTESSGGSFHDASDSNDVLDAFETILSQILGGPTTFTSPATTLKNSNKLQHNNNLYIAFFQPTNKQKWHGNVKNYKIVNGVLKDFSSTPINVLDGSGNIQPNARSNWLDPADNADGAQITKGGVEHKLPATRTIKTDNGTSFITFDNNIAAASFGAADDTERDAIVDWAIGANRNKILGDPLHSQPIVIDFGSSNKTVLFFATNEGFLHAVDVSTGEEIFAYIPQELLSNLKKFKDNATLNNNSDPKITHPYGLDGDITALIQDNNNDGSISGTDKVYIYFGMRRGGSNYYALDVSSLGGASPSPSLKWKIIGGTTTGFDDLGETWSKPIVTKYKYGSTATPITKDVLIFGGGYDTNQDDATPTSATDSVGNRVYIVDAIDGSELWTAGDSGEDLNLSDMDYSIPSELAAIDLDLDGVVDRLYFGDMGGQIFRIDLDRVENSGGTETFVPKGWRLANLGGSAPKRRFYSPPEIVFSKFDSKAYIAINIGSGYRAHPVNDAIDDRFYSLRDDYAFTTIPDGVTLDTITEAGTGANEVGLYDATSSYDTATIFDASHQGWYIDFTGTKEKVLTTATTANNQLMFATYIPPTYDPNMCSPPTGSGNLYTVNLFSGAPVDSIPRKRELKVDGIPPSPVVIYEPGPTPTDPDPNDDVTPVAEPDMQVCIATECYDVGAEPVLEKTYWTQEH